VNLAFFGCRPTAARQRWTIRGSNERSLTADSADERGWEVRIGLNLFFLKRELGKIGS
jgi:hypothetical protein